MEPDRLLEHAHTGDSRAIARVISEVEDGSPTGATMLTALFPAGGAAWTTGITGAPGSGKSTLTSGLIPTLLPDDGRLAVVAVDPSSPFSGGAILGDRIRMMEHAGDHRVFIRSLANRGSLGGISESTPAVLAVLDGLGFAEILVETVGVGQSEVEIATTADTTVVVVSPGWGDAIQVSKAGFLEVADILVVNKADRPDVEVAVRDLEAMLEIGPRQDWHTPVVRTVATTGEGIAELRDAIRAHRAHLVGTDALERRRRVRAARELAAAVRRRVEADVDVDDDGLVARIAARTIDPWSAADDLLSRRG